MGRLTGARTSAAAQGKGSPPDNTAPRNGHHPGSVETGHNLAAVIEATARVNGWETRPAFLLERSTITHGEVHDGVARAASVLGDLGVDRGDVVLIAVPDGVEFVWAFLGAVRVGALAVPVNPELTADDHRSLGEDCGASIVVCTEGLRPRFVGRAVVITDAELVRSMAAAAPHPAVPVGAGTPAYAQYTSGTTGAPKAAVHRHGDPVVYAQAFAESALGLGSGDVVLSVSKMYFAYGLGNSLFFPLLCGARAVLSPDRPPPTQLASLVERHRVSVLFAVPTFYAHLVRECEPAPPAGAFDSVRVAVSAGERLTTRLAARTSHLLDCAVLDGLGSTEVGQTFASNTVRTGRHGTVGRALPPYELAVRARDGTELPAGKVGPLWVRGPTVLLEYLGRAGAATDEHGWLRTEDLACIDADGFVHLHGRSDDMEMVGGISVAPGEIEELLGGHDAVAEVAVVAVADDDGASRLQAFVVPATTGAVEPSVADELTALARAHLAPFKVPRTVTFVDRLPRTPTGKLRRFLLRSGAPRPLR